VIFRMAEHKNQNTSFFCFVTNHAFNRRSDRWTDGRTDRILIARLRLHSMQRGKNLGLETPSPTPALKNLDFICNSDSRIYCVT